MALVFRVVFLKKSVSCGVQAEPTGFAYVFDPFYTRCTRLCAVRLRVCWLGWWEPGNV